MIDSEQWNKNVVPKIKPIPETQKTYLDTTNNKLIVSPDFTDLREKTRKEYILDLEEAKADLREAFREKQKARVEIIAVDDRGDLVIEILNTRNEYAPRSGANFKNPKLSTYVNELTGEIAYMITLEINDEEKKIWMNKEEIGDAKILLKKFNSIGANFLTNKQSLKKDYVQQLWTLMLRACPTSNIVSNNLGWNIDCEGNFKFVEEEMVWQDLIKNIAKSF